MSWLATTTPGANPFERVRALRPDLQRDLQRFVDLFWERRLLPLALLELLRLHVARLLDCRSELGHRYVDSGRPLVAEDKVASLAEVERSPLFSEGERACLRLADKFVFDVHGIEDSDVAAVQGALGTRATVALVEWLALCDGLMRLRNLLGVESLAAPGKPPVQRPVPRAGESELHPTTDPGPA